MPECPQAEKADQLARLKRRRSQRIGDNEQLAEEVAKQSPMQASTAFTAPPFPLLRIEWGRRAVSVD